ncbi:MAG TPA: acyl carrier protein, partial [Ktedonobacteraceae bacterium]|nr:acyl carrier protein [Ktedonobacteraceae bacterium]
MELRHELKEIIMDIVEIDDFNDDDNLVTQLNVDSMLLLEIVARIEKRYRIRIPEDCFPKMETLNAVVHIVSGILQPVGR